jgi:hypothetical protein
MAADWWARGVGIGAALVASVNAAVTVATYRRNRPRVVVEADYRALGQEMSLTVKIINKGSVNLPLDQVGIVWIEISNLPPTRHWYGKPVTKQAVPRTDISMDLEERHPKLLPAFGAVEWYFDIPIDRELYDWFEENQGEVFMRVRVPLTHLPLVKAPMSNVMEGPTLWLLSKPSEPEE